MQFTQDDYKLYTGQSVNFTDEDWQKLVQLASSRLARFLCLESLPTEDEELPSDLALLFANFLCLMLADRGNNPHISSKKVRNFTINYDNNSATNAFAELSETYGDIIAKYSACGLGISAERDAPRCCNGCI